MESHLFGRKSLIVLVSIIFVGLLHASVAHAQTSGGTIPAINGTVAIRRGTNSLPAVYGMIVQVGDRVTTSNNGRLTTL